MSRASVEREFFAEHPGQAFDESWHKQAARVQFAVEPYADAIEEMRELYEEHWQEIALDKDAIKLEPDYAKYAALAAVGILHLVTARIDGAIIGYHMSLIYPHLHYKSSLTCFTDVFFVKKEFRLGMIGYNLLKFFRDSVKERGVQKIYMNTKLSLDLDVLLRRLGFKAIERVYTMVFK